MATVSVRDNIVTIEFNAQEVAIISDDTTLQAAIEQMILEKALAFRRAQVRGGMAKIKSAAEVSATFRNKVMALVPEASTIVGE